MRDCFDLPVTGADATASDGYAAFVTEFLGYGPNVRGLFAVADAAPACALINAHAAALHLAFEGAEGWTAAAPYFRRMDSAASRVTEREALFCTAVARWRARDFRGALEALEALTVRWPADLCAAKWGQYHAFNLGDQAALLRFGERARIVHEGARYVHGMAAFGLEQNHRIAEAEDEGLKASEIAMDDAWAHHALAHVYLTREQYARGARWLDHCAHVWDVKGTFIREHNWWHAAVFAVAMGRNDTALKIFDERLWGEWTEFPQEIIGAVSMLWRLELSGVDVGDRWTPIAGECQPRIGEHILPFHDIHYLCALERAGNFDDSDRLIESVRRRGLEATGGAASVWRDACLPAASGMRSFARGDDETAAELLSRALPFIGRIGGSHAQREIFQATLNAATWRQGRGRRVSPARL